MKRAALLVALLVWPVEALSSGFEYPDNGTVALGRGSAFAAKANDGTAIYYNPSGLAQQDGWRVLLDGQMVLQSIDYQRTDASGTDIGPAVSNSGGPFFAPFIAISKQVLPGLTIAIGGYGPPANGKFAFPDESPPQLTSNQQRVFFATCGLGVAQPPCAGADTSSYNMASQKYQLINENLLVFYPSILAGQRRRPSESSSRSVARSSSSTQPRPFARQPSMELPPSKPAREKSGFTARRTSS